MRQDRSQAAMPSTRVGSMQSFPYPCQPTRRRRTNHPHTNSASAVLASVLRIDGRNSRSMLMIEARPRILINDDRTGIGLEIVYSLLLCMIDSDHGHLDRCFGRVGGMGGYKRGCKSIVQHTCGANGVPTGQLPCLSLIPASRPRLGCVSTTRASMHPVLDTFVAGR